MNALQYQLFACVIQVVICLPVHKMFSFCFQSSWSISITSSSPFELEWGMFNSSVLCLDLFIFSPCLLSFLIVLISPAFRLCSSDATRLFPQFALSKMTSSILRGFLIPFLMDLIQKWIIHLTLFLNLPPH